MLSKGTKPVPERSARYLTVTFLDKYNALGVPISARYRLDDLSSNTEVLTWTDLAVTDSSHEITITAEQNRILKSRRDRERRQVTVEATGSDGEPFRETFEYEILNLTGTT
jgi:hypothetical protein